MASLTDITEDIRLAARALGEFGAGLFNPTVRLGVTGLSGAGKTVFITALVHQLAAWRAAAGVRGAVERAHRARPPRAAAGRRGAALRLRDACARADRGAALARIDQPHQRASACHRVSVGAAARNRTLTLDIVDYPGEWLLDLPLLATSYAQWSADTLRALAFGAARDARRALAPASRDARPGRGRKRAGGAAGGRDCSPPISRPAATSVTRMRLLPPGRFLMPGDLAGSPALTFAPLELSGAEPRPPDRSRAMMERRYEAYKDVVVRPFYREHFARLDRQIVLVDALAAFNAGPDAVKDLEGALAAILDSFRTGRATIASALFRPRIDRILFAATKADHLHHASHDRLERFLARITERADRAREILRRDGRCRRARGGARDARGDGRARARQAPRDHRHAARRRNARRRAASTARPKSPRFRATCRTIRPHCSTASRA